MEDWFEEMMRDMLLRALADFYNEVAETIETAIRDFLDGLEEGEKLSKSPLIKALSVDEDSVTFFIRGNVKIWPNNLSAFMRIQVVVSKDTLEPTDWETIIGEAHIKKSGTFDARLGLGYDQGTWSGRGALKLIPAKFGVDILLGGLNERGAMVGLDVDLPVAIPLGATGMGLTGMGGDFAYNFVPRVGADPNAQSYVNWARNHEMDRWMAGPVDETAVGVGIRTDLGDMPSSGEVFSLEPIGFAVITPGPIFVLGGIGKLVNSDSTRIEGYVAVDVPSGSIALGAGVKLLIPKSNPSTRLVEATGTLNAFFSVNNPASWYLHVGTEKKPIKAKILADLLRGEVYLMINNNQIAFGAAISIGGEYKWWIITLIARIGAGVKALIGWNPQELAGEFRIFAELGIKIWKFSFILSGKAAAIGHVPDPEKLEFLLEYKLDLPWPIPDVKGDKRFLIGDEDPPAPSIAAPLLADEQGLGAIHPISGRQWSLQTSEESSELPWSDLQIVVPFNRRVTDTTSKVLGPSINAEINGGYRVDHLLTRLQIHDLVNDVDVPDVKAVWANAADGESARLHIMGDDPYSWMTPHTESSETFTVPLDPTREQRFGIGPEMSFTHGPERFGEVAVFAQEQATLTNIFAPTLSTRVLDTGGVVALIFVDNFNKAIMLDYCELYVIESEHKRYWLETPGHTPISRSPVMNLDGDLQLVRYIYDFSASPKAFIVISGQKKTSALLYSVRYRGQAQWNTTWTERTTLMPGRYRLNIEGNSTAVSMHGLNDGAPVAWEFEKEFEVAYPPSLRPYLNYLSAGDTRIIRDESMPWNPTMQGVGFPAYRHYYPVVRFNNHHMGTIFGSFNLAFMYEDEGKAPVSGTYTPTANSDGDASIFPETRQFIEAAGGTVTPDEELVFAQAFTDAGSAQATISFVDPEGTEHTLDSWTCFISSFADFRSHIHMDTPAVETLYTPAGPVEQTHCPIPSGSSGGGFTIRGGNHIDQWTRKVIRPAISERIKPLLAEIYPLDDLEPFPDELDNVPASWRLSSDLTRHIQASSDWDARTALHFAQFADDCDSRLTVSGEELSLLAQSVESTRIDALVDSQNRPYALWLRTPEPLDWRRVTGSLKIRHLAGSSGCPTEYAHRRSLTLPLSFIPSADGSSAFMVGEFNHVYTRLPRGEFELTLSFDPELPGLHKLQPGPLVAATPEVVQIRFIQPAGQNWPQPIEDIVIPGYVLDRFIEIFRIQPDTLQQLFEPPRERLSAEQVSCIREDTVKGLLPQTPRTAPVKQMPEPSYRNAMGNLEKVTAQKLNQREIFAGLEALLGEDLFQRRTPLLTHRRQAIEPPEADAQKAQTSQAKAAEAKTSVGTKSSRTRKPRKRSKASKVKEREQ